MARLLAETGLRVESLNLIDEGKPVWHARAVGRLMLNIWGAYSMDGTSDRHYGPTRVLRPFESRELAGTTVANDRQVSIGGTGDMRKIAEVLGLPIDIIESRSEQSIEAFMARQLAINVLVQASLGQLNRTASPGDTLAFGKTGDTITGLVRVSEYNPPCAQPGAPLTHALGQLDISIGQTPQQLGADFKKVAGETRGWVGSVWSEEGFILPGQEVYLRTALPSPA